VIPGNGAVDSLVRAMVNGQPIDTSGPSILQAVRLQLGLQRADGLPALLGDFLERASVAV
jgi:hypothetical protein